MRGQVIDAIFAQMDLNPEIFFLNADMGINLVEKFGEKYPERYANVGIAEQNLVGICAGLANLGYRPFAYTISNFMVHRCFEQIRNDIGLHDYPVTLLGTSTGFDNAPLGPTHHIIDEWGTLKSIPNIDIYCPSSVHYAAKLVSRILQTNRPAYIRIPKGEHKVPESDSHLVNLPGQTGGVVLATYGNPAQSCIEAQRRDPHLSVLIFNRLRPIDEDELVHCLLPHDRIVVVEDHFAPSGLYGSLCEIIARRGLKCKIASLAPSSYAFDVGTSPEYFFKKFGLDVSSILQKGHQL